ncbi:MAG: zf-HC2 domain-containing protein [Planctomycetes bacterium]|jgi:anti-sigma factor RsiW|nr:zf-HC2 domain-containing protein [Planctomycetota bacterium]
MTDFVDGALRPGRDRAVREHLASCEACRGEESAARTVVSALASLSELPLPEDGFSRLEARLAFLPPPAEPRPRGGLLAFALPYAAGLATAAVLLLVVLPLLSTKTPAPVAPADAEMVRHSPATLNPGEEPLHYVVDDENILREIPPELLRMLRERRLLRSPEAPVRGARTVGYEGY